MTHTCHADGCDLPVPPRIFMHRQHWFMIPKRLRDELWDAYVPGQERHKDPTAEYLVVAERCIVAVAVKEGRITQAEADRRVAEMQQDSGFISDVMGRMGGQMTLGALAEAIADEATQDNTDCPVSGLAPDEQPEGRGETLQRWLALGREIEWEIERHSDPFLMGVRARVEANDGFTQIPTSDTAGEVSP